MANSLLRVIASLLFITSLLAVVLWLGNQQRVPNLITQLHLKDCEPPCWLNITPGKTTISEAEAQITRVYGNDPQFTLSKEKHPYYETVKIKSPKIEWTIVLYWKQHPTAVDDYIEAVSLDEIMDDNLMLGDVINLVGTPDLIGLSRYDTNNEHLILQSSKQGIQIYLSYSILNSQHNICDRITVNQHIFSIWYQPDNPKPGEAWRGFDQCY